MNILVDPNPLFDPKNSQFWLFLSENEIFAIACLHGAKVLVFCLFLFWRSAKETNTLAPWRQKK